MMRLHTVSTYAFIILLLGMLLLALPAGLLPAQEPGGRSVPAASGDTRASGDPEAFVIPIHGDIDRPMLVFLRRGVEQAKNAGARTVIFDIDTFGGRVDSALQITTLIGSLEDILTVAYVTVSPGGTGVSWSAGALIAMACDRIYMAPGTSIGAAAPVQQGAEGMEAAPEKVVSAVRTQMAALAEKNGYPPGIALAMVDQEVELLEVAVDGEIRALTRDELAVTEREVNAEGGSVEVVRTISAQGKLLSLTAGQAERYAVSSGTVATREDLYGFLDIEQGGVTVLEVTTADRGVSILAGGAFTSLLILIGLIALYLEITSPGFGVPGTVAIICFGVLFTVNFLLGTVGSLELLLFILGLVLLAVEIFLIPGFGVTGISGLILIAGSLIFSRQDFIIPDFSWQWDILYRNVVVVLLDVVGSLVGFAVLSWSLRRTSLFNRLILTGDRDTMEAAALPAERETRSLVGKEGIAVTVLRPSGKAEIDERIYPVVTDGEYVDRGDRIRVIRADGFHIVVERI